MPCLSPTFCFSSTRGPLVATGHLASHSHGSWLCQTQQRGESLGALPQVPWPPTAPSRVFSPPSTAPVLCSAGNYLFFGCRQKSKDFYCQAEWEELVTKGFLTLFTAFSRDQVSSQRRRVDTEASRVALMGLCQCFWPLYLLAWPVKGLVGCHSAHLAPPHPLSATAQLGHTWLN